MKSCGWLMMKRSNEIKKLQNQQYNGYHNQNMNPIASFWEVGGYSPAKSTKQPKNE
jgi:hypothetical protein